MAVAVAVASAVAVVADAAAAVAFVRAPRQVLLSLLQFPYLPAPLQLRHSSHLPHFRQLRLLYLSFAALALLSHGAMATTTAAASAASPTLHSPPSLVPSLVPPPAAAVAAGAVTSFRVDH